MKWEIIKLGDIATCIQPGPFGSQLHRSDYSEVGTPIIMPKDMAGGVIKHGSLVCVSDEHVKRLQRHQVHAGDIMVARKGDVTKCVYITEKEDGWLTGSDCLKIVLNCEKCYSKYIYYQLRSPIAGRWLERHSIGATMPSLNTPILSSIEISLPDLSTQRRIASILSAYDDLIENNRHQIKLLEEAAQRLYREWFVELRFPGHESVKVVDGVPEGWEETTFDDVIEFDPKVPLTKNRVKQSVPMAALSISSMVLDKTLIEYTTSNSGSKFKNGDTLLARITPCLENGKTAFVNCIDDEEGAVGSTEYIVMRSKKLNPYMVYCIARSEGFRTAAINSMTGSDGRQRAQKDKLKVLPYVLPNQAMIQQFEKHAAPWFDKVRTLNEQNRGLVEARNMLLPKLMNGEME